MWTCDVANLQKRDWAVAAQGWPPSCSLPPTSSSVVPGTSLAPRSSDSWSWLSLTERHGSHQAPQLPERD